MSQFHYLSDDEIAMSIETSGNLRRASLLDANSTYIVCTVPSSEKDRLRQYVESLQAHGLKPILYRESGSQNFQIYFSFTRTVASVRIADALATDLLPTGTTFNNLENPFVLPLQQGFCWLNDDLSCKVSRDQISTKSALAMFLRDLKFNAVSPETVEHLQVATVIKDNCREASIKEESGIAKEHTDSTHLQLLIFPAELNLVEQAVTGTRPKRLRRARSNLPDASMTYEHQEPTDFTSFSSDAQGGLTIQGR